MKNMEETKVTPKFPLSGNFGGAEEDRTPDPLHAMQVLSQLSYSPTIIPLDLGYFRI